MAAGTFDPMAQKVARLTKSNQKLEQEQAALQRDIANLAEERDSMAAIFKEQLQDINQLLELEMSRKAAAEAALAAPSEEVCTSADELAQLEDELTRTKAAARNRAASWEQEVDEMRRKLKQDEQHLERLRRSARVMRESYEGDRQDRSELQSKGCHLADEVEELEAALLKWSSQVNAWQVRLAETNRGDAEAHERWAEEESALIRAVAEAQTAEEQRRAELAAANERCAALKLELAGGVSLASGDESPSSRRAAGSPTKRRHSFDFCSERGAQTHYISEQASLLEEVDALTEQLHQSGRRASERQTPPLIQMPAVAGQLANLLTLCLRPDAVGPPSGAASIADRQQAHSESQSSSLRASPKRSRPQLQL
eukprot:TRINITY_DN7604_c2_g1_i1.p1 TRINITY_DN7604_c2_g1~~TRINITY_DN7604_c2_g1_i1.p1  ORF type:complete len:370 (+),score=102.19 TRINITY_DN7604_c2_g1_i1:253-1362(+)